MVNSAALQGNWNEIKGKLREKWGQLTDDDLANFNGKTEQLIGAIQRKTGEARANIEEALESFIDEGASIVTRATEAAREYAGQAAHAVSHTADQVTDKVKEGVATAENLVQERPAESLALAFGTGMVAGLLVGLLIRGR